MTSIHPQLLNDCHPLGRLKNCTVLLHKNAALHWFILVPDTLHENLLNLNSSDIANIMKQAQTLNHYLENDLNYKKTNVASIGNVVKQIHLHVVGRRLNDACWPQPVWGNLPDNGLKYDKKEIESIIKGLNLTPSKKT